MMNRPYYHLDGTTDWLKTAVKTVITYNGPHEAIFVESIAARRAQRMYYRRTAILNSPHEMRIIGEQIENILFNDREVTGDGGRGIRVPLKCGKTPTETLQNINEDLNELMGVAWDMLGRHDYMARFEECSIDTLRALESNLSAYNEGCDG